MARARSARGAFPHQPVAVEGRPVCISAPRRCVCHQRGGVWIVVSIAAGFPARWETIFQTLVAALTLTMVFVIQHTQARHQRATQRKLDKILRAMPGADNSLLTFEHASDEELRAAGHQHREIRQATLDDHSGPGAERSEEDPAQRPP